MLKIGVLVSGGGTNFQAIIDAIENKKIPDAQIVTLVSSSSKAFALERAKKHHIEGVCISKKEYSDNHSFQQALITHLQSREVDLVVLAGFMVVLDGEFIHAFENRIINIHPSLIPSFCGNGYYGLKVHEAALKKGVKLTGATVHFVTEETDAGPIILQKAVEVHQGDSPEELQQRVMKEAEWVILPEAIRLFSQNKLRINHNCVNIM